MIYIPVPFDLSNCF